MHKFFIVVCFLCCSCTKLPVVSSISEKDNAKENYRFYDAESKIRYQISHTDEVLHIRLNTTDPISIRKILDYGLHIYFDPAAKKAKKTYIQYPLPQYGTLASNSSSYGFGATNELDLKAELARVPQEFVFKQATGEEQLLQTMLNSGIRVTMFANSNNELTYDLQVPFAKVAVKKGEAMSIGIVSGSREKADDDFDSQQSQQGNNIGPRNQMGSNVGRMSRVHVAPMEQAIEIWFQLDW